MKVNVINKQQNPINSVGDMIADQWYSEDCSEYFVVLDDKMNLISMCESDGHIFVSAENAISFPLTPVEVTMTIEFPGGAS